MKNVFPRAGEICKSISSAAIAPSTLIGNRLPLASSVNSIARIIVTARPAMPPSSAIANNREVRWIVFVDAVSKPR